MNITCPGTGKLRARSYPSNVEHQTKYVYPSLCAILIYAISYNGLCLIGYNIKSIVFISLQLMVPRVPWKLRCDAQSNAHHPEQHEIRKVSSQDIFFQRESKQ